MFRKHSVIVLSDEIYSRLNYTQSHITLAKVSTPVNWWSMANPYTNEFFVLELADSIVLFSVLPRRNDIEFRNVEVGECRGLAGEFKPTAL